MKQSVKSLAVVRRLKGGRQKPPQLSFSFPLVQTERVVNLSEVHEISNLVLVVVAIFTVVLQNEVLATRNQSLRFGHFAMFFSFFFRSTDTRELKV